MKDLGSIKDQIRNKSYKSAISSLNNFIKKNSNNIEANYLLGYSLELNGEFEKSILQYEKTNKLKEGFQIYDRLALLYAKKNDYRSSIVNYKKSLNLYNHNHINHNNLGVLLALTNQEKESQTHFKKAIELNRDYMDPKYNLLEIYEKTNDHKNLSLTTNSLVKEYPKDPIIKFFEIIINQYTNEYKKTEEQLKNLNLNNFDKKWEIRKLQLLGNINFKLKKYNQSFKYYEQSNNNKLNYYGKELFNNKKYLSKINKCLKLSNKSIKVNHKKQKNNHGISPIFLVGFPRSGTTLLDAILSSHKKIKVVEEQPILRNTLTLVPKQNEQNFIVKNKKILAQKYIYELNKYIDLKKNKKKVVIDKLPLNIVHMRNIHQIFPESKFICCIRHPLDCILSCFIQNFELNEAMVNFLDLKRTAELYNKIMTIYSNFTEIPEKNIFNIKYEEIVKNYKSNTSKLLSFLKLRWNEEMNLYYKKVQNREIIRTPSYKQVIQPIYKDSKYKWVKYKKNLEPIIPRVEKWIRYFNYNLD
tara:strand:+ start:382 stop:1965 length:1584 start_codon:yes stop_codon:yes gene_type:complete